MAVGLGIFPENTCFVVKSEWLAVDFGISAACAQKGKGGANTPCNYKGGSLDPVAIGFLERLEKPPHQQIPAVLPGFHGTTSPARCTSRPLAAEATAPPTFNVSQNAHPPPRPRPSPPRPDASSGMLDS